MQRFWFLFLLLIISSFLTSCEEDIALTIPAGQEKLVVQGYIEQEAPPFLLLTRSVPVFSGTEPAKLAAAQVTGARVTISNNGQSYVLTEILVRDLPTAAQEIFAEQFGVDVTILQEKKIPLTVYTNPDLKGALQQRYDLHIEAVGQILNATTTIPNITPVDSLWFMPHSNTAQDSLVTLWYRYSDPAPQGNNIRYFTSRNGEPFYPGHFTSVLTDEFVNGRTIDFPLERGWPKSAEVNNETYSYFRQGDTVRLKWAAVDYPHYQFWFTLEADRASNGNPFGFPTTIRSNINGGLGIWGGYAVSHHTVTSK